MHKQIILILFAATNSLLAMEFTPEEYNQLLQEPTIAQETSTSTQQQSLDFVKPQCMEKLEQDLREIKEKITAIAPSDSEVSMNKKVLYMNLLNKGGMLKNKFFKAFTTYMTLINAFNEDYEKFLQDYATLQQADWIQLYSQLNQDNNQIDNV